jgi:hypothetical protein
MPARLAGVAHFAVDSNFSLTPIGAKAGWQPWHDAEWFVQWERLAYDSDRDAMRGGPKYPVREQEVHWP